jgi:predicted NBD/HSP70 family sugar kinase
VDLKTPLEVATGIPVTVECAPNACALSEIWFGKHPENVQDLVVVAVSEGVGAGIFSNGQLLRGPTGMAGEYGHIPLNEDGPVCNCGNHGCWEAYASNSAAVRHYLERSGQTAGRGRGGKPARAVRFEELPRLAREGDGAARETLERMGHYLGLGIAMIVTSLAPSIVVVVGEVVKAWDLVEPSLQAAARERIQPHLPTRIVATSHADHPRLRGAVATILHSQLGAPLLA